MLFLYFRYSLFIKGPCHYPHCLPHPIFLQWIDSRLKYWEDIVEYFVAINFNFGCIQYSWTFSSPSLLSSMLIFQIMWLSIALPFDAEFEQREIISPSLLYKKDVSWWHYHCKIWTYKFFVRPKMKLEIRDDLSSKCS